MGQILPNTFLFLFLMVQLQAQTQRPHSYSVLEIGPTQYGDSLTYKVSSQESSLLTVAIQRPKLERDRHLLHRTSKPAGNQEFLEVDSLAGLFLHRAVLPNGHDLIFDRKMQLLPAQLKTGEKYHFTATFKVMDKGRLVHRGHQKTEIKCLGFDSAYTPFQNFAQCLVLYIKTTQQFDSEKPSITTHAKKWYVKGLGLVKMAEKTIGEEQEIQRTSWQIKDLKRYGKWLDQIETAPKVPALRDKNSSKPVVAKIRV